MASDARYLINALWILTGLYWALAAPWAKTAVRKEQYASRVLHIAVICVAFDLLFGSPRNGLLGVRYLPPDPWLGWIGLVLVAAGAALALWARALLGSNWSGTVAIKGGHELVRTGPYAWVRHPIYSGLLLSIFGTALALGELRGLAALAVALLGWGAKAANEERFLVDQFDGAYIRYQSEVKHLIPFLF